MTKITITDEATNVELQTEFTAKQPIKPGQKVRIEELPDGSFRLRFGYELEDMVGLLNGKGIHATIEEINEAIAEAGAGR